MKNITLAILRFAVKLHRAALQNVIKVAKHQTEAADYSATAAFEAAERELAISREVAIKSSATIHDAKRELAKLPEFN